MLLSSLGVVPVESSISAAFPSSPNLILLVSLDAVD